MAQAPLIPFDYLERQKRREQQQPDDPVARAMGVMQVEQARSTIIQAPDPDTTAKVTRAARETGEPPALIEDRLGDVEKAQRAEKMGALLDLFPIYRLWAQENPRDLVAASGDHKALGVLGQGFATISAPQEVKPTLWNSAKGVWASVVGGFRQTDTALSMMAQDFLPNMSFIKDSIGPNGLPAASGLQVDAFRMEQKKRSFAQAQDDINKATPAFKTETGRGLYGGAASLAQMAPALAVSIMARSPVPAMAIAGAQTGVPAYGKYRARGGTAAEAATGATLEGGAEAGFELIPMGTVVAKFGRAGFGKFFGELLGKEMLTEQATTIVQDAVDTAIANPDKTWGEYFAERPSAAYQTALAVLVASGSISAASAVAQRLAPEDARGQVLVQRQVEQAQAATQEQALFDHAERAASISTFRQNDPDGYAGMVGKVANDAGVSQVFIPAAAIRAYQQSDSYDQFDDPFADYQAQIDEADAVGGDVVLPAGFALGTLPGTAAWTAVKADLRLAPGGMSSREAETLQAELDDVMAELSDQAAQRDRAQQGERDARGQIVERVTAMLQNAGFTPANAAMQAELIAQREATRAARMGRELTGNEFTTQVVQVLPEKLGEIVKADQLDLVVNALRKGGPAVRQRGKSLLEWISARGGIEDRGGDIASMGGDKWHLLSKPVTGKNKNGKAYKATVIPGRRKLLKDFDAAQGNMLGGATSDNSVERLLDAAISEGFFPDLYAMRESGEAIDNNVLLEAIGQELGGSPLYAQEPVTDNVRAAADELAAMLSQRGLDPSAMSDEEIRNAVAQMGQEGTSDVVYDQLPESIEIDGVARPTRNSEGMPLAGSEEGLRAFWAWFGDSKVVDEEGRPLVVYHGTNANVYSEGSFETFNTNGERGGAFFSSDPQIAEAYGEERYDGYLSLQDPLIVFANGKGWSSLDSNDRFEGDKKEPPRSKEDQELLDQLFSDLSDISFDGVEVDQINEGTLGAMGVYSADIDAISKKARKLGYDGVIVRDVQDGPVSDSYQSVADTMIAFSPTQIKSINNRGTFDPADARILYQSAYHGSPHIFDRFSLDAIGTGEGAQAYGWGLYFAGRKEIAEFYRNTLTLNVGFDYAGRTGLSRAEVQNLVNMKYGGRYLDNVARASGVADKVMDDLIYGGKNNYKDGSERRAIYDEIAADLKRPESTGRLYQVEIPDEGEYLLWDKPLSEQPEKVQAALDVGLAKIDTSLAEIAGIIFESGDVEKLTGQRIYEKAADLTSDRAASMAFHEAGIAGIKYLDGGSRSAGDGSFNYVVFDDSRVSITAYEQSAEVVAREKALFDALMDDLTPEGGANVTDAFEQMEVLSNAREDWAKALGDEPGSVELKNRNGLYAAITKSQENPDGWRVTWFDKRGFSGHVETKTKYEAAKLAIFEGYDVPAPGALREAMAAGTFFQRALNEGPRGRILMDGARPFRIELFQARNLSTLLHELSHQWLEELRADAESPDAPDQIKADWQAVQDWFAKNGHPVTDGVISVEAHEMWARGGERYLMEGKSPSSALQRLFETFRGWLLNIYKTVDALRAPITPEIREVFDRLLATDEEIAAMAEMQALTPMFKDAAAIGMTGEEFDAYTAQAQAARNDANATLLQKTMAAIRRRETKKFNDERNGVKADEAERLDQEPLLKSIRLMRETPIDQEWLIDRMGQDVLDLLPKRVPPLWREGGTNPDTLAELAGFGSGQQMIEVLIGAERQHRQAREGGDQRTMRARMIDNAADAEMTRRYGDDPLNDGSIEQEAIAAVNGELQGELLASEVRLLSRRTGKRPTPYKIARQWARNRVRTGLVSVEASPGAIQRHARNVAKAGRDAEKAMLAGKMDEALRFKQQQMLSSALLAEAKAAHDEVQDAVKRMGKIAKRATMKSVDQDYLEQAHALLEAVDLKERTQKSIERQGRWEAWSAAREAEGYEVVVPPSFEATLGRTNWSRLPVETLLGLDEAVAQVMHLGRLKQSLLDRAEQREWDEIFTEAENAGGNIDGPPPKDMTDPGWWDALKGRMVGADASLLKMETVFDWLDGGDPNGVFNRIAFRPIAEAQAREQDMLKDYYGRIKALFEAVPADVAARWQDKLELPFVDPMTGAPARMNRHKVIAMALNVGNEGNLQRLSDGYGWNPQAIEEYLNATLTAEEWQFVQGVWDTIDTLWPEVSRIEREVNGVAPDKVEAREVVTPFGTLRGGYYPAVYDSTRDYKAEENRGRESDLFEGAYTRATTRASATKERAEKVKRPLLLDLGVINRHLGEVIHDVTHREAVIRANRFLTNERVMRTVDEALGPEIRKQFRPWLKFVANSWAIERAGNEGFGKFIGQLRANATVVGMGLRATTMVTQIAGYSNSIEVVGEVSMAKALAQFSRNPAEAIRWVMEASDEVRNRMDTLDRDIRTELARLNAVTPVSKVMRQVIDAKRFVFHGIGYMDRLVSVPTWIAGYNNALAAGMDEQDARYAGDKAVRQSQGAGGAKDLAAIQRGTGKWGEALKLFTMFYSYFSAQYQRQRTLGRDVVGNDQRRPRSAPKLAARAFFLLVLPPLLTEVLRGAVGAPAGPDDDEWWAQWTLRKMLANALGPIPLVRDVFEPTWNAVVGNKVFNPSISPLQRAMDSVVKVGRDVGKLAEGDETKSATKDVLELTGYATGLVPGQVASATQFLVDVGSGEADPQGFGDWIEGLSTGKIKED